MAKAMRVHKLGVRSVRSHVVLLSVSALLLLLAFPAPGWGIFAHIALVPMTLLALRSESAKRLAWTSWVVFSLWWLLMIRWMIPVTGGGWFMLSLFMASYTPAYLVAIRWLDRRYRSAMVLAMPMVWTSLEYIRGNYVAGGFGWFNLSHSQAPYHPDHGANYLMQIADLFGEYGVTFLVAMTNGVVVDLLTRPWVQVQADGSRKRSRTLRVGGAVWVASICFALMYGMLRVKQTDDVVSPALRVAVVQTNVPQNNKTAPTRKSDRDTWAQLQSLTVAAAASGDVDLVVWPETMVPGAINEDAVAEYKVNARQYAELTLEDIERGGNMASLDQWAAEQGVAREAFLPYLVDWYQEKASYRDRIAKLAQTHGLSILVGSPTQEARPPGAPVGTRYNSVYHATPAGRYAIERFDKMHRVPFGEYTPWVEYWPWLKDVFIRYLTPYDYDYSLGKGETLTVFTISSDLRGGDVRVATPVCFEDTLAYLCRRLVYAKGGGKRVDMLVNVTNDGWFAGTSQPWQQLQAATLRTVENRVPMARSVNTGVSGFIDSAGRVGPLVDGNGQSVDVPGWAVQTMASDPRSTLFGMWGNATTVLVLAATVLLVAGGFFRREKGRVAAKQQDAAP